MTVEKITEAQFRRMKDEWNDLLMRSKASSPMLTWEWMYTWWEFYSDSKIPRQIFILTARSDGKLVGILPLVRRVVGRFGLTLRRLEFIGTGEGIDDETCSEFLDCIVADGKEFTVVAKFVDFLGENSQWDEILCRDVRADDSLVAELLAKEFKSKGLFVSVSDHAKCPYILLPSSWDDYLNTLSEKNRKKLQYNRRRLQDNVDSGYRSTNDICKVMELLPVFEKLHQRRWCSNDASGAFASPIFTRFLESFTKRYAESGGVEMATLRIKDKPVGIFYLLRHGSGLYYYNSGVDTKVSNKYSPGSMCLGYIIEEAIKNGLGEFHFFKGNDGSYKYQWTDNAVSVVTVTVRRKGWKHNVCTLAGIVRSIRYRLLR